MTLSEQIRIVYMRAHMKQAEVARKMDMSPQKFSAKLREERFTRAELEQLAEITGVQYKSYFLMPDGEIIE